MAEIADWTGPIDQQTQQNNLAASPEGQMARMQGLASLAHTQGQIQGQQLDIQAKKLDLQNNLAAQKRLAELAASRAAKGESAVRGQSDVTELLNQADDYGALAKSFAGTPIGDSYQKKAFEAREQAHKLKMQPVLELEQNMKVGEGFNKQLGMAAERAIAFNDTAGLHKAITEVIKGQMQLYEAGGPPPNYRLFTMSPQEIAFASKTAAERDKEISGRVADAKTQAYDSYTGTIKAEKNGIASAKAAENSRITSARERSTGKTGGHDIEKQLDKEYPDLDPDIRDKVISGVREATNGNSTINPKHMVRQVANAATIGKSISDSQQERQKNSLKTKEQLAEDLAKGKATDDEKPNNPYKISNDLWDNSIKIAQRNLPPSADKKERPAAIDRLIDTAQRVRKGEMDFEEAFKGGGFTESDKASVRDIFGYMNRTQGDVKIVTRSEMDKIDPGVRSIASTYGAPLPNLVGMKEKSQGIIKSADESLHNIDDIAGFIDQHPAAVGSLAKFAQQAGGKFWQFLDNFDDKSDPKAVGNAADEFNKANHIAGDAAVLNKKLITQALSDVQQSAGGRMNVWMEKTFAGLYDQAFTPSTMKRILYARSDEAARRLKQSGIDVTKGPEDDLTFYKRTRANGGDSSIRDAKVDLPRESSGKIGPKVGETRQGPNGKTYYKHSDGLWYPTQQ